MTQPPLRVVIAEDSVLLREGLARLIEESGGVVVARILGQYVERQYATELLADRAGGVGYLLKDRVADIREFMDALRLGKLELPDSKGDHRRVLAVLAYLEADA